MTEVINKDEQLYLREQDGSLKPVLRGWESFSGWYWFATEINEESGIAFGFVQGFEEEWGTFSIEELENNSPKVWEIPEENLPHSGRRKAQ